VLSVDAELNFVAMHVFHMLDQHLAHVLKRLRKATAEGSLKINHAQLVFNLRDGVSISPDGASLRLFITDACGGCRAAYYLKKQDQLPFRISTTLFEVFVNGRDLRIDNKAGEFMTKPVAIKDLLATLKFNRVIASGGGRLTVLDAFEHNRTAGVSSFSGSSAIVVVVTSK
jgi:hypothetical protein